MWYRARLNKIARDKGRANYRYILRHTQNVSELILGLSALQKFYKSESQCVLQRNEIFATA
jgi:hypothetical protein